MQRADTENSMRYHGWAVAASLAITELTSWGILLSRWESTPHSFDLLPVVGTDNSDETIDRMWHNGRSTHE
jgi:hypothetical protein